jgi:hypothetical protein
MVLTLKGSELLRLRRAAGSQIEVLSGRAWVTEAGRARDGFLAPGARYRVAGNGLVLLGAEGRRDAVPEIELALEPPSKAGLAHVLSTLVARYCSFFRR